MSDDNTLDSASLDLIQETIDQVRQMAAFSEQQGLPNNPGSHPAMLRGYLMQGVSRGQQALVHIFCNQPRYRTFKIDLAGIIYKDGPAVISRFGLRFKRRTNPQDADLSVWFDVTPITITGLTDNLLLNAISRASIITRPNGNRTPQIPMNGMLGALGHPTQHTLLIPNDELYPSVSGLYKRGDLIDSKIGSWVFSIDRAFLPPKDEDFDIKLLMSTSTDPTKAVEFSGPAFMTKYEIKTAPTTRYEVATDIYEVASPTPLRGGSLVTLGYFEDIGYGIIGSNVREYLFEQEAVL